MNRAGDYYWSGGFRCFWAIFGNFYSIDLMALGVFWIF